MKNKLSKIVVIAVLMAAVMFSGPSRYAADSAAERIYVVDSLYYDGSAIDITYSVRSGCSPSQHIGGLDFELDSKEVSSHNLVVGLKAVVYDIVQSDECRKGTDMIKVSFNLDFQKHVAEMIERLTEKGYEVTNDYYLELPKTYVVKSDTKVTITPSAPSGNGSGWEDVATDNRPQRYPDAGTTSGTGSTIQRRPAVGTTYTVIRKDYALQWHCNLDKHSPAKKNNFDGYGSTEDEARRDAGSGCARTNAVNPNCSEMSWDPYYTTCDVDLQETTGTTETVTAIPDGAQLQGWSCLLNKNDGSRRDGFTGEGASIEEAQASAANMCMSTNNPLCEEYSLDGDHTSCNGMYMVNATPPQLTWTCVLDKHSPAKRNTFYGTGSTKDEARQSARAGCAPTNPVNPNCSEMSLDPKYTSCTVTLK